MDEQKSDDYAESARQLIENTMTGNPDRARACLKRDPGCVNAQDPATGITALHLAIVLQNVEFVTLLAGQPGCNPWIRDRMNRAAPDMLTYTRNRTIFEAVMAIAYPEERKMWQELQP